MGGIHTLTTSGLEPVVVSPGGTSDILAVNFFYPSTQTTYTPTSSMLDLDATNASVTFAVPDSGEVWVMFSGPTVLQQAQSGLLFALREGTTEVSSTRHRGEYLSAATAVTNQIRLGPVIFHVTGLTPGATHTYKVAWMKFGAGATASQMYVGDPTVAGWGGFHTVVSASPLV